LQTTEPQSAPEQERAAPTHPFTMDGHQDAVYYARHLGGTERFDAGVAEAQLDLPGLRAGQVDASFWAIFGEGEVRPEHDLVACVAEVDDLLARYRAWLADHPAYTLMLNASDLATVASAATGAQTEPAPFGVLLHLEGARGLSGPVHLHELHAGGLRSLGLTWNHANDYATGAHGDPETPLTPAGRELIAELNRLRMVIDGAHLNRRGLWDVLELSSAPVLVTHTACAALNPNPRNLQDDQIKAIAASGGVIGVFYANMFLAPTGTPVTIDTVLAHYDHLLEVAGPEHVALGTDLGGISSGTPEGLAHIGDLPALYAAFRAHGYSDETIAAIRGGNYLRVVSEIIG
jgi:membrane dipeptidase